MARAAHHVLNVSHGAISHTPAKISREPKTSSLGGPASIDRRLHRVPRGMRADHSLNAPGRPLRPRQCEEPAAQGLADAGGEIVNLADAQRVAAIVPVNAPQLLPTFRRLVHRDGARLSVFVLCLCSRASPLARASSNRA